MAAADRPDWTHAGRDEMAATSLMTPGMMLAVGVAKVIVLSGWQYLSTTRAAERWSSSACVPQRDDTALLMDTAILVSSAAELVHRHACSLVGSEPHAVVSCAQR